MRLSRRALLAAGLATATGTATATAGCLDPGGRPTGPSGVPARLDCPDDGFRRLDQPVAEAAVVASAYPDPDDPRFELAAEGTTLSYGTTARFALRNRTDRPLSTGPRAAFGIQRETEAGWVDVRGTTAGPVDHGDATVEHAPGAGFTWSIELTEAGLAATGQGSGSESGPDAGSDAEGRGDADADAAPELTVCPALGPGPYRFLYWGLDGGVAAEFELVGRGS